VTEPGRLQGATGKMSIGTAAGGIVKEILMHQGSRVHAGQLLVTMSCGPIAAETQTRDAQGGASRSRPGSTRTSIRGNLGG
jgi:multidrug efflux pump subunit AcrA (membrane-fusion protein)